MHEIEKAFPIREEMIDENRYFESLLEHAVDEGLITEDRFAIIRKQLYELLERQWNRMCDGQNSSISMELAEEMMTSILYVNGICLKSCSSVESALRKLKRKTMEEIFDQGLQIIDKKVKSAGKRYHRIDRKLMHTDNMFYTMTIRDGMREFFHLYKPAYSAHDIHIILDYPLFAGRPDAQGIELVEQYLMCMEAENAFCVQFEPYLVDDLLRVISEDYDRIPVNIFQYALFSVIGLVLCQGNPYSLRLIEHDVNTLYRQFEKDGVQKCIETAVEQMEMNGMLNRLTRGYLELNRERIISLIEQSLLMHTLHTLFLVPVRQKKKTLMYIRYGEEMTHKQYMTFQWAVRDMDSSKEKAEYIIRNVHAYRDLLDLFADVELDQAVMDALVPAFPMPLFALLYEQYGEELLCENQTEKHLSRALQKRYNRMSEDEREIFETIEISSMDYSY